MKSGLPDSKQPSNGCPLDSRLPDGRIGRCAARLHSMGMAAWREEFLDAKAEMFAESIYKIIAVP
jgi:hypothetical protein